MTAPRVIAEPLGGSALSLAVQRGEFDASIVAPAPRSTPEWKAHAQAVARGAPERWFDEVRAAFGDARGAPERLARTARAGGIVVTTGQQAGLFGGPIYTWSKALAALALADALERATGVPAAPVFWAATDDADFAEASRTYVVGNGGVACLELSAPPPVGTPMALAPLGDASPLLARLRDACGSMAYERAYAAVEDAYRASPTVGGAYVRLLRALLEPLGVAVLDASHPAVRRAGAGVHRRALEGAADVSRALAARQAWLVKHGFEPQVADVPALSTVFVYERGTKRRVPLSEAGALANADGTEFGPNVLLRPVVERTVLPTVAYVAGPGELAYFAQVSAVAEALGAPQPVAVPRWSCTIVEPAVERALERLGAGVDDMRDTTALERRVARAAIPDGVRQALFALRGAVSEQLALLAASDAASPEGALLDSAVVEGAARQLGFRLDRLERRLAAAAKRRGSDALRDLQAARDALWPTGHRQERTLNFIPLLARYGDALWTAMRASADSYAARLVAGVGDGG
ncbi:MAG TPA: bacillithiol biosynthesis cysteine-adding enzyme BshC [Gemmatimonadaceae bacterium]